MTPDPLAVGDVVVMRDWRTGRPYVPSPVTRLAVDGPRGAQPCAVLHRRQNDRAAVIVATAAHTWIVPRGKWARDVLSLQPPPKGTAP